LGHVLALELYTAAQALDFRRDMIEAARRLARRGDWSLLASKVGNAPAQGRPGHEVFMDEVHQLGDQLAAGGDIAPSPAVARALERIRGEVGFMRRDRAMDGD